MAPKLISAAIGRLRELSSHTYTIGLDTGTREHTESNAGHRRGRLHEVNHY